MRSHLLVVAILIFSLNVAVAAPKSKGKQHTNYNPYFVDFSRFKSLAVGTGGLKGQPSGKPGKSKKPALNKWKAQNSDDKQISEAILQKKVTLNDLNVIDADEGQSEDVVVISSAKAKLLSIKKDTLVILKGKKRRETIAKVSISDDIAKDDIKMSSMVRNNIALRFGDVAVVSTAPENIKAAKSISVAVYGDNSKAMDEDLYENFVKPYFLNAARAVRVEDRYGN